MIVTNSSKQERVCNYILSNKWLLTVVCTVTFCAATVVFWKLFDVLI